MHRLSEVGVGRGRSPRSIFEGVEQEAKKALDRHLSPRWLAEACSVRFGEAVSLRYRVVVRDPGKIGVMSCDMANIEGVERIVVNLGDEGPDRVA